MAHSTLARDWLDLYQEEVVEPPRGTPGRLPATARLVPRTATNIIFRVHDAASAAALASSWTPRDERPGVDVGPDAEQAVAAASSTAGHALPDDLRQRFEASLGTDLGAVRIHTGDESAAAARAVGAKAYTVGQDIHFAAGKYATDDPFGVHLLAHEVAHTVQQRGGTPARQHKLEVSSPQDAAELEADRAADAMVRAEPVQLAGATGGPQLRREPEAADDKEKEKVSAEEKQWATTQQKLLEQLKTEITTAKTSLAAEVEGAIGVLEAAGTAYTAFEKRYEKAEAALTAKFKKALKAGSDQRAVIDFLLSGAISLATAGVGNLYKGSGIVTESISRATQSMMLGAARKKMTNPGTSKTPGGGGQADWKGLFSSALTTFKEATQMGSQLDAGLRQISSYHTWLDGMIAGSPDDGGVASVRANMVRQTESMTSVVGTVSIPAGALTGTLGSVQEAIAVVEGLSIATIKQNLAIRWIAALSPQELEAIDDTDDELKELGVIDKKNNRLGIDTGTVTSSDDERMVWLRAQVETEAMATVGATMQWLGKQRARGGQGNQTWQAVGPSPSVPPGSPVVCVGYSPPSRKLPELSGSGFGNGPKDSTYKSMVRSNYVLQVKEITGENHHDPSPGPSVSEP